MPSPTTIASQLIASTIAVTLAAPLLAHGGQYRGPGSILPPSGQLSSGASNNQTNGSTKPGNNNPAPPSGPSKPSSSGPAGAAASGRPAQTAASRGYVVGDDLGRWEFWWEFGKDPFLRLRDTIYSDRGEDPLARWNPRLAGLRRNVSPPTEADVRGVAAQLRDLLKKSDDRDTSSSCLIALAKIGSQRAGFDLTEHFTPFLARGDQELRESAALSIGVAGDLDPKNLDVLVGLVEDNNKGRALSGKGAVNERTRAFAAYAAGLLLRRSRNAAASLRLTRPLQAVLAEPTSHGRNLTVAAIEALAQFPRGWESPAANTLRRGVATEIGNYYDLELGAGDQLVQAHVPTALARLLQPRSIEALKWRDRFAKDLAAGLRSSGTRTKVNHHIAQSCALALGHMCEPWETDNSPSHAIGELLVNVHRDHRDYQTRSFAVLSLARIGGQEAMDYLVSELSVANKALEQPWLAVALGVLAAKQRADGSNDDRESDAYRRVTASLLAQLEKARNPSTIGALAIALGLTGAEDARDILRRNLVKNQRRDDIAGYVALALGLLRDTSALNDLRDIREGSSRRPFVMMQSVRALGLLGDYTLTAQLSQELSQPGATVLRLAATASALMHIGDRRCLPALRELVAKPSVTPLTQAFAIVALGGVCDKDPLPWNSVYASFVNYRASTETLTDGIAGILDLL